MRRRFGFLATLLIFFDAAPSHAGAWGQPEGQSLLISNSVYYTTGEAFDARGERVEAQGFRKYELNPYLEYGLDGTWTLGASAFLHALEQEQGAFTATNSGIGDIELFARRLLVQQDRYVISIQPLLMLPGHYTQEEGPVAGRGAWDAELAVLGGYGFDWQDRNHYLDMKAAYRHRSGVLSDQYRLSAGLGLNVAEALTLLPEVHFTAPARKGDPLASLSGQNDYTLLKAQLSVVWQFNERYALQLGGFRHVAGEDTGAGGGVMVAVWTRW